MVSNEVPLRMRRLVEFEEDRSTGGGWTSIETHVVLDCGRIADGASSRVLHKPTQKPIHNRNRDEISPESRDSELELKMKLAPAGAKEMS